MQPPLVELLSPLRIDEAKNGSVLIKWDKSIGSETLATFVLIHK